MNTPDSRPIGVLTPAILATASHWCFLWCGRMLTMPTSDIEANGSCFFACGMVFGYGNDASSTCYPCTLQPNGLVVPEPWPVLDGDEEIQEWRGMSCEFDAQITSEWGHTYWALFTHTNNETAYETELRPGYHPAPRKGGKWVWEADKC